MEKGIDRLEAFSDGVFAIAITLLILEIKVPHLPHAGNRELLRAMQELWPSFLSFLGSFVAILIMWINHHGLLSLISRTTPRLLFANGFLLLLITFVPFPTALLANYLNTPAANAAAGIYCLTYVLINVAYNMIWASAAAGRRSVHDHVSDETLLRVRNAYLAAFPLYAIATAACAVNGLIGLGICSALWILWARLDYSHGAPEA